MGIRYICYDCRKRLGKPNVGFHATNEVGRKFCDFCGGNHDDLNVIGYDQFREFSKKDRREGTKKVQGGNR